MGSPNSRGGQPGSGGVDWCMVDLVAAADAGDEFARTVLDAKFEDAQPGKLQIFRSCDSCDTPFGFNAVAGSFVPWPPGCQKPKERVDTSGGELRLRLSRGEVFGKLVKLAIKSAD